MPAPQCALSRHLTIGFVTQPDDSAVVYSWRRRGGDAMPPPSRWLSKMVSFDFIRRPGGRWLPSAVNIRVAADRPRCHDDLFSTAARPRATIAAFICGAISN